ncbi:MAG: AbrB/MazE/SpoVT family DNA-binding domain-containing protein [Xanthomonadaceae bacterium]|nr:AbrB/MazE/SpoVT family DNA-binding domain-containing protein [Xanthomonadaceae bacterium]MDP2184086.1 AbrB/MazE/SpoVT family DNA-binding domain-containing protein [Xanthomonadales bacterium]MDZ4377273.1 AbrB/MazE/SpoVT family DNA-binding domain-containing protein [Xanthomonadaceae bacterium]
MPVLSPKRQVTLPKELCDRLAVAPGDDLDIVEHNGHITILKQAKGRSAGVLKHLKADSRYSDAASRDSAIAATGRRARPTSKPRRGTA